MKIQILLWVHLSFAFVVGLKEVRIETPFAVKKGDSTKLYCWYNTEGDPLYIVKWYKSGREFYRYVPREKPPTKSFPIGNLLIKESESNASQVTLTNVNIDAAGSFSCEITVDEPTFQTAVVSGIMNVVELPSHRPSISGLRSKYRVNDTLKINCSSKYSKPAANLTWYINNKQANISLITYSTTNHSEGISALSYLIFPITSDSFFNSSIKIRCSASIYDIYWQSTEVSAEEDKLKYPVTGSFGNVIGINYHQPPPNFQLGQKKLDGEIDIKVIGNSGTRQILNKTQYISWITTLSINGIAMIYGSIIVRYVDL